MGTPFTSARNGLWDASDVDTWGQGAGVYPQTAGDVVNIGHTVTYNKVSTTEMGQITINNNGILTFSTTMSTKLTLGYQDILINNGGELRIGALGAIIPAAYTAETVWNTTTDAAKGLNIANGGKLNIYGDPNYYGSKFNYLVATQVSIPANTNSVTITIAGNYAANFATGHELLVHSGGACLGSSPQTSDFARLTVISAANNGANTDISCTVTDRPAVLTCLGGADVLHLSRNVNLYKLNYNANLGQWNANRPKLTNATTYANKGNINISGASFAGWVQPITGNMQSVEGVFRNGTWSGTLYYCTVNGIYCMNQYGFYSAYGCTVSAWLVACVQAFMTSQGTLLNGIVFGCNHGALSGGSNNTFTGYVYSCYYGIMPCYGGTIDQATIGYDPQGVAKANTYDFYISSDAGYFECRTSPVIVKNTKMPAGWLYGANNSSVNLARIEFEHYLQQANRHFVLDSWGTIERVLFDGTSSRPNQRSNGNDYGSEVITFSSLANPFYLKIFNIRLWATANISKTYRFYLQTDFTALTKANLVLYAEYLDNNPAGTGHLATINSSGAGNFTTRANQADWSQYVEVTVNPSVDGWVNLYLWLMQYQAGKKVWIDPMVVSS